MKMKVALAISAVLLITLALQSKPKNQAAASPDKASGTHTGKLQGRITGSSGRALKGATVILTDTTTREENRTTTDKKGAYTFSALFPGQYLVRAEAKGYKPSSEETRIQNGSAATVNLKLTNE